MSIARGRDWGEVGHPRRGGDGRHRRRGGRGGGRGPPGRGARAAGGADRRRPGPDPGRDRPAPRERRPGAADRRTESADPGAADRRTGHADPAAAATGGPGTPIPGPAAGTCVRVDAGAALVDGWLCWFVAHLVARRSWWRGRVLVVANAAFMGPNNVAPRAHPGDGHLDVLDTKLRLGARIRAKSRLAAGAHVPHPDIAQRRVAAAQFDLDPALDVYGDGLRLGRAAAVSVRVEPAALEVWLPVPGAGPRA